MTKFVFTKLAEKNFYKLPQEVQKRILTKLEILKEHECIFSVLRNMRDFKPATHRLRIGSYRLILQLKEEKDDKLLFWILDVGHRREVYR